MKIASLFLSFMFVTATHLFAQTPVATTMSGTITEVKAKFLGAQSLIVDKTELVLMSDQSDTTNSTFKINKKYKDILVKKGSVFVLNPKYAGKTFKFTYFVNGKGWKCISNVVEEKKIRQEPSVKPVK